MHAFLSYRREDSSAWAGRLRDSLAARFGPERVFQDVVAISPGDSFDDAIDRALEQCDVTLVVIGPRWLETRGADGTPRLADSDDYVRRELVAALEHGQHVIPVLVGGAAMPAATALPPELRPLARRQAVALRDETWHADVDRLIGALTGSDTTRRRSHRVFAVVALAAAAVIAVTVAVVTLTRSPEDSDRERGGGTVAAGGSTTTFNVNLTKLPKCSSPSTSEWTALAWSGESAPRPDARWDFKVLGASYRPSHDGGWEVVVRVLATNPGGTEVTIRHLPFYELLADSEQSGPPTCFDVVGGDDDVSPLGSSEALVGFYLDAAPTGTAELAVDDGEHYRVELTASRR